MAPASSSSRKRARAEEEEEAPASTPPAAARTSKRTSGTKHHTAVPRESRHQSKYQAREEVKRASKRRASAPTPTPSGANATTTTTNTTTTTKTNTLLLLERTMREIVGSRRYPATACPSEVPRLLVARRQAGGGIGGDWRALMDPTREIARRLAREGVLQITQRGQVVEDLDAPLRGPIRLRPMPTGGAPASAAAARGGT
jgi:hypothetical protein